MAFIPLLENLEQIMPPAFQSEFHRQPGGGETFCAARKKKCFINLFIGSCILGNKF
jgi:hypothetical protein